MFHVRKQIQSVLQHTFDRHVGHEGFVMLAFALSRVIAADGTEKTPRNDRAMARAC